VVLPWIFDGVLSGGVRSARAPAAVVAYRWPPSERLQPAGVTRVAFAGSGREN
jgi:hypothetical protein